MKNKKRNTMGNRILATLAIVFVGLAFGIAAIAVFITRGKSAFWTDKKLKIGGVLLSLSGIIAGTSGCGVFHQPTCYDTPQPPEIIEQPMCYDMPAPMEFSFEVDTVINAPTLKIEGRIRNAFGKFTYKLTPESSDTAFLKGPVDVDDGGKFTIETEKKAPSGTYTLGITEQDNDISPIVTIEIKDDVK